MRLFKTFSHTSTLRGYEASGKTPIKQKKRNKPKCESAGVEGGRVKDLASKTPSGRKKNVYQNALRTKPNSRARNGHRASPCGGDVGTGRKITRKIPPGKQIKNPEQKRISPEEAKFKTGKTGSNTRGQWSGLNVNQPRPRLEIHLRYFESPVQRIYPDGVEGTRNLEHLLCKSCSEPERAEA